ncbi:MAG: hypothetical protein VYA55_22985 [Pseudomonadota bacterium]|nr:hypothetical protein [Pseudomonadota bacterium]
MSYQLEVFAKEGYICAEAKCDINRIIAAEMAEEVSEVLQRENLEAALIDVRNSCNTDRPAQNYQFAFDDAPNLNLRPTDRIAILSAPDDHSHDFTEIVMRNSGYNVRLFQDEDDALAWLAT